MVRVRLHEPILTEILAETLDHLFMGTVVVDQAI